MSKLIVQEALSHLVGDLRATHGENLASVVLYGSAAAGDHIELRSDYNLLIALHRIGPEDLRLAQAPVAKPDCVRATVDLLKLDRAPFERIFEFRAADKLPATEAEANAIFAGYMDQIEQVIEVIDELDIRT